VRFGLCETPSGFWIDIGETPSGEGDVIKGKTGDTDQIRAYIYRR
jgi:hypothetical protein